MSPLTVKILRVFGVAIATGSSIWILVESAPVLVKLICIAFFAAFGWFIGWSPEKFSFDPPPRFPWHWGDDEEEVK